MKYLAFCLFFLVVLSPATFAQAEPVALDEEAFNRQILAQSWRVVNDSSGGECGRESLRFSADTASVLFFCYWFPFYEACLFDWQLEGKYFEFELKNCSQELKSVYVFGYLDENETMWLCNSLNSRLGPRKLKVVANDKWYALRADKPEPEDDHDAPDPDLMDEEEHQEQD